MTERPAPKFGILTSKKVVRFADERPVEEMQFTDPLTWEQMHTADHYLAAKWRARCPGCGEIPTPPASLDGTVMPRAE